MKKRFNSRVLMALVFFVVFCFVFYPRHLKEQGKERQEDDTLRSISLDTLLAERNYINHNVGAQKEVVSGEGLNQPHLPIFMRPGYSQDVLYPVKIPKIIHQIWDTYEVPRAFHAWMKTWKDLNPTFQHWFWSLDDARRLIRIHYPHFLTLYDSYLTPIFRADAARYFIIHHYGGFYFDLDCKALKSLVDWSESYECLVSEEPWEHTFVVREENQTNVLNGLIACMPRHPFLQMTIDSLEESAGRYYGDVIKATGPHFFNRVFNKYIQTITSKPEPHILPYLHQQHYDLKLKQLQLHKGQKGLQQNHNNNHNTPQFIPQAFLPNVLPRNQPNHHPPNPHPLTPAILPSLTKLPSKYFFPTYDRSESETLVSKCSPGNFKKLNSLTAKALCKALIRKGFRQEKPGDNNNNNNNKDKHNTNNNDINNINNNNNNIKNNDNNNDNINNNNVDNYSDAYADHDWLHSYNMAASWKLANLSNVTDVIEHVILASNQITPSEQ